MMMMRRRRRRRRRIATGVEIESKVIKKKRVKRKRARERGLRGRGRRRRAGLQGDPLARGAQPRKLRRLQAEGPARGAPQWHKVYDGPHRVPSTPKRHVEIQSSHDYSVMMEGEEREREKERERGNVDVPQNSKGKRREGAAGGRHTRSDQRSRSGDNRRHRMRHREPREWRCLIWCLS